ncbi:MAG: hypothetical protein CTY34_00005, partial [Methylobacter sp.]
MIIPIADTEVNVIKNDGKTYSFSLGFKVWSPQSDINERLTELKSNGTRTGWRYVTESNQTETYDAAGKLLSIKDVSGVTQTLTYSTAATPVAVAPSPGLLLTVTDSFGR